MKKREIWDTTVKLCINCFHCKTKNNTIYCKIGVWKEDSNERSILHTPYDFNCNEWED